MNILGLQLHSPHILDLPMVLVMLVVTIALSALAVHFLGWDITQVSAILFGASGAVIANACGVDVRKHGLRGVIVTTLFSAVLVVLAVAIRPLLR
jgi:hypothetical protein